MVDVIVNTTAQNLDLRNGAVSSSLSKAAGQELQDEVTAKFPNGLEKRTIAVTGGYKLNSKLVIHTALSNYIDNNPKESIKGLHKVMKKCLEEAQRNNSRSIAFPAFGTGNLGFPRNVVAKEMFKAVENFQKDCPKTSVKDVRFIVYQMDSQTFQAFKVEETKLLEGFHSASGAGKTGQTAKSLGFEVVPTVFHSNDQETSGNYSFDGVTVMIKPGDITQENTECIVNSTNAFLNFHIGKVSQALMKLGGIELQEEIENHKTEMMRNKIVTTLAPGLPCRHIIHVEAEPYDIAGAVKKCLKEAENARLGSIALPAFATRNIYSGSTTVSSDGVSEVAKSMVKAARDFSKSQPRYVKEIRFVIYQDDMLPDFLKAAEDVVDSKSWIGNVWKGFKSAFGRIGSSDGNDSMKSNSGPDYNSVSFIIIAMSDDIIRKAIKNLEDSLEKEMHTKIIDDHTIRDLEDIQVDEIQGIAHQCHVQMTMDKRKATIKLAGIVTNVMNASDKINKMLRDAERMEFLKNIAQWFYIEVSQTGETVTPYDKDINMEIENAYKSKKPTVAYLIDNIDYILDFGLMEEYPEHKPSDKVKVIRRDLVKGGTFELPANWDDMKGGNLRVVSLFTGSQEYKQIEKQFKDSAGQYTDKNGQRDYTVVKIERVQNKVLWEQYQAKKKQLEEQNPSGTKNERELWHGTSADPVDSINAHGFNRSYCGKNATVYGDGVYFALDAKYSCQNTYSKPDDNGIKRMYLCKVLTGVFAKGELGMRVPPPNPNGGPHALYDSVTNNIKNPNMFIIFHDTQACPEYLIYFKE